MTQFIEKLGGEILLRTQEHVILTITALIIAALIAVPLGILLARSRFKRGAQIVMSIAGMFQTIPTLALVSLVVLVFAFVHLPTVGTLPALVALIVYALLPILRNTFIGIKQVDPNVIEVAKGMGMTRRQILFKVELPLSMPVIMGGIRIAAVWTIGIATLCALVGAGGLGDLILKGLRSYLLDYLLAGTIPAAILALLFDGILALLENWMTPKGVK